MTDLRHLDLDWGTPASRFTPSEQRAIELVVAANQRAEELAARLVEVRKYALEKGDHQLAAIVAIRKPVDNPTGGA